MCQKKSQPELKLNLKKKKLTRECNKIQQESRQGLSSNKKHNKQKYSSTNKSSNKHIRNKKWRSRKKEEEEAR